MIDMDFERELPALVDAYLDGTIPAEKYKVLRKWVARSGENHLAFDRLREEMLAAKAAGMPFDSHAAFERFRLAVSAGAAPAGEKHSARIRIPYGWAAAVLLAVVMATGAGTYMLTKPAPEAVAEELPCYEVIVPQGGRSRIVLPDGSTVFLNAGTKLRYNSQYGSTNRDLWLEGEGYFVVEKSGTEFAVHSKGTTVKALGTEFNVRAYAGEDVIEATLVKGKIAVRQQYNDDRESEDIILFPNQKIIIENSRGSGRMTVSAAPSVPPKDAVPSIFKKDGIDPLPDIAWKDNRLVIVREPLRSLAVKLERKYDVDIGFADPKVMDISYTGTLEDESIEQVLDAMMAISPIRYTIKGKNVTIRSR